MSHCALEKIEILSFGKLKQVVLQVSEGLQVLTAPNESGKSTVAAFLRFVFYGYPDSRKKELTENDKKLYTPWDSPISEGSVILKKDGVRYRVFRSVQGAKETCVITCVETGKVLTQLQNAGEYFFGVSEEVFSRTLFFRQLTLPQSKDGVMAEQLQNIAVSADEQVSSRRAMEQIIKAKNDLKGRGGNGRIPTLERECVQLENQYHTALEERKALELLRTEQDRQRTALGENAAQYSIVKAELHNILCAEAATQLKTLNRIRQEAEQAEQAYLEAKAVSKDADARELSRLSALHTAYTHTVSNAMRAKQEAQHEEPTPTVLQLDEKFVSGGHLLLFLSLIGVVLGISMLFVLWMAGAAVIALSGLVFLYALLSAARQKRVQQAEQLQKHAEMEAISKEREAARQSRLAAYEVAVQEESKAKEELQNALLPYGISIDDQTAERIRAMEQACHETSRLEAVFLSASRSVDIAFEGVDLASVEDLAAQAKEPVRDRAAVERELRFLESQARTLGEQAHRTEMQIAAMEAKGSDPGILLGKWQAVKTLLEEYRREYTAYEDALAGIAEASDQMKRMVSPRIGEIAGKYFSVATDGKYTSLAVDTRLAMELTDENGISRDCDYLSAGARDSVYLCLRLALTELLYGSSGMPMVLDDAFGRLDDARLLSMLRVLSAAATKHQIFLFCCTHREETMLTQAGLPYTRMTLEV